MIDQTILDGTQNEMVSKGSSFFAQSEVLRSFAQLENPSEDAIGVEVILEVLNKKPDLRRRFFELRPHPAWIKILWDNGFFATPPEPELGPDGREMLPFWDVQWFLQSNALQVPDLVVEHLRVLDRIQALAGFRAVAIRSLQPLASEMAEYVKQSIPIILRWLEDQNQSPYLIRDTWDLTNVLAVNQHSCAFELMKAMTKPQPSSDSMKLESLHGFVFNAEAASFLDANLLKYSDRGRTLRENLRQLDFLQLVDLWQTQILDALTIEALTREIEIDLAQSLWIRGTIEDSNQNFQPHYKDVLLDCLRDTLESQGQEDFNLVFPIIKEYWQSEQSILRRLGVHLTRVFADKQIVWVQERLLNRQFYEDTSIHHEFLLLLRDGFSRLSGESRQSVVELIRSSPTDNYLQGRLTFTESDESSAENADSSAFRQALTKVWQRDRLWMIQEHLRYEDASYLDEITAELNAPEHPEHLSYMSGVHYVEDISPVSREQLELFSPQELLNYLREWQPDREAAFGDRQENWHALARDVGRLMRDNIERYAELLNSVAAIRPELANALLNISVGIESSRDDEENDEKIGSVPVKSELSSEIERLADLQLGLMESLLANESIRADMEPTSHGGWPQVRLSIIRQIETCFLKGGRPVNEEILGRVRDLLLILCEDPDPSSSQPSISWPGDKDPITASINHVRSDAVNILISYALARERLALESDKTRSQEVGPSRLEPVVSKVLTHHLNHLQEVSRAVHSVYGRRLSHLYWLDKTWVEEALDNIFPIGEDDDTRWHFVAAWEAWVIFNNYLYQSLFERLREHYVWAIESLALGFQTSSHLEPVRALATHLFFEFFEYPYDLYSATGTKNLLGLFFEKAPPDARGRAAWVLWRYVAEENQNHDEHKLTSSTNRNNLRWMKAREFWQWRIEVASKVDHTSDFDVEIQWLVNLLEEAPAEESISSLFPILAASLPHLNRGNQTMYSWNVLEKFLAREVNSDPDNVIRFYRMMYSASQRPIWAPDNWVRQILEATAAHDSSRDLTAELIDHIARKGNYDYLDIFRGIMESTQ